MAADERALTPEEQAALDAIEGVLARPTAGTYDTASVAGIAALLRSSTPQAEDDYRQKLRERLRAEIDLQSPPPPALRITRRRLLAAGLAAATVGGAAIAVPKARAAVAALFGWQPAPPSLLPPVVERTTPLPLSLGHSPSPWTGADDAQREYYLRTIVRERWAQLARLPVPGPPPGTVAILPDDRPLPIPGFLPPGFHWQGVALSSDYGFPMNSIPFEYVGQGGGGAAGGGGSGMPWERPMQYDHHIAAYVIGGDPSDRLLLLQQLKPDARGEVTISVFQMDQPPQAPPPLPPGATPPPGFYGARTVLGILVEPARDQAGIAVQVGPNALHPTTVAGAAAWWFSGEWAADGRWIDDGTWISVVWSRDGFIYCLSGQQLGLDELLRVAESLP